MFEAVVDFLVFLPGEARFPVILLAVSITVFALFLPLMLFSSVKVDTREVIAPNWREAGPCTDALGHRYDKYGYRIIDEVDEDPSIPDDVIKGIIEDLRDRMLPSEFIPWAADAPK